jgi:hypothetical protein
MLQSCFFDQVDNHEPEPTEEDSIISAVPNCGSTNSTIIILSSQPALSSLYEQSSFEQTSHYYGMSCNLITWLVELLPCKLHSST